MAAGSRFVAFSQGCRPISAVRSCPFTSRPVTIAYQKTATKVAVVTAVLIGPASIGHPKPIVGSPRAATTVMKTHHSVLTGELDLGDQEHWLPLPCHSPPP